MRTNAVETGLLWDDIVAAGGSPAVGVIIPKAEDPKVISQVDGALTALEMTNGKAPGSITIIPLIESALGVRQTYEMIVARERVAPFFSGAESKATWSLTWEANGLRTEPVCCWPVPRCCLLPGGRDEQPHGGGLHGLPQFRGAAGRV